MEEEEEEEGGAHREQRRRRAVEGDEEVDRGRERERERKEEGTISGGGGAGGRGRYSRGERRVEEEGGKRGWEETKRKNKGRKEMRRVRWQVRMRMK
ncbi:hypothetical protein MRB53_013787 [Persea americana]|uniref:Uncharacterized protein n=1 Tax=Persea americana TaxID=3435 RepID=A0ACC2K9C8_PERAE|nr:hypothetical protein MRB53_013787 [Persea americana]